MCSIASVSPSEHYYIALMKDTVGDWKFLEHFVPVGWSMLYQVGISLPPKSAVIHRRMHAEAYTAALWVCVYVCTCVYVSEEWLNVQCGWRGN